MENENCSGQCIFCGSDCVSPSRGVHIALEWRALIFVAVVMLAMILMVGAA